MHSIRFALWMYHQAALGGKLTSTKELAITPLGATKVLLALLVNAKLNGGVWHHAHKIRTL